MPDEPRNDNPREDHRKDYSILHLFMVGIRMTDDYDEDKAVKTFLRLHPEADEAEVRAELMRELKAINEGERPLSDYFHIGREPKAE